MGEVVSSRQGDRSFLGGGRRASTLRARVRASKKYLAWLAVSADVAFPSEVSHLTGFFESRHSEPCNRGALKAAHQCMAFLEDVAGIDEKLTTNAFYTVVYRKLLATAQPGRTPRQAPRCRPGVENATPPSTVPTEEKVEAGISDGNLLGDATTLLPLSKEVMDVLTDQTRRGQLIRLSEEEAKIRFSRLVIASLGANRKDRPNGEVTNGLSVNTKTRLRDQERSPISSDIKRAMREKASRGLSTFALTADVKEAHRQIPIGPRDWHLLGCQVERGADVFVHTVGTFGITSASYYWSRVSSAVGRLTQYLGVGSS